MTGPELAETAWNVFFCQKVIFLTHHYLDVLWLSAKLIDNRGNFPKNGGENDLQKIIVQISRKFVYHSLFGEVEGLIKMFGDKAGSEEISEWSYGWANSSSDINTYYEYILT